MFGRMMRSTAWLLALAVGIALLAGCSAASARVDSVTITIAKGGGQFAPYIQPVEPNSQVTWRNADTVAHTITTTPDQSAFLNPAKITLTIPAGGSASLTLSKPGLYDYYEPNAAQWSGADHRVRANANAPGFPLAMEGVIWVEGKIAGLPSSATNPIPGKDLFTSQFLAIPSGGTIYWYNADTDAHTITQAPGWPAPINPASFDSFDIKGTEDAPPNGETHSLTFDTPGLYYYYCSAHARIVAASHRAAPIQDASAYPIAMEGFILVTAR
ncbi:MAG TPA: plastocyanin/azurin family copper-binding protein [Ktedonobacterales bacterium]